MKKPVRNIHSDMPTPREAALETVISQAMPEHSCRCHRIARYLSERWSRPWKPTKAKHGLCWLTVCEALSVDGWLVKTEGTFSISPALKLRVKPAHLQLA
jgi:hypothetical protein